MSLISQVNVLETSNQQLNKFIQNSILNYLYSYPGDLAVIVNMLLKNYFKERLYINIHYYSEAFASETQENVSMA